MVTVAVLGGGLVAGCSRATPIPDGAQVVHVVITESEVSLDPARVLPGDIYLILDAPRGGSLAFVEQKASADATPGPLTSDDLARLADGNTESMSITGLHAGGCDPEQNHEDRGQMGPCGNVLKVTLAAGAYAVVAGAPEGDPLTLVPPLLALLNVRE
jgi:hypothetical protein